MKHNHNLILKYLEIIQQQETMINELSKSNTRLVQRNRDLKQRKAMYKENTLYWKAEHDKLQQCLIDIKVKCTSVYETNALKTYQENQKV